MSFSGFKWRYRRVFNCPGKQRCTGGGISPRGRRCKGGGRCTGGEKLSRGERRCKRGRICTGGRRHKGGDRQGYFVHLIYV